MRSPGHVLSERIKFFFKQTGHAVYRHPHFFFWLPVLVTLGSTVGLLRFHEENRIWYLYSPSGAPSHHEHAVANEFFNDRGGKFWMEVSITSHSVGNLLEDGLLQDVERLADHLEHELSVPCGLTAHKRCAFDSLCSGACNDNKVIPLFSLIYRNESTRLHPNFRLTYPTMRLYNDEYYVGEHFAGVALDAARRIRSVRTIVLYFRTDRRNRIIGRVLDRWERHVSRFAVTFKHPRLNMSTNSDAAISREVRRNGITCVPYFSLSVAGVFLFIVLTSGAATRIGDAHLSHSFVIAVLGIAGPLMAVATTFCLLFMCGYAFNSIVLVMPFLVIGVGCDDVFIIVHAWKRTVDCGQGRRKSLEDRIADTMEEAGPSITVTSLTNMLSFAIGVLTPTPAISLFCLYTAIGVAIDFIYQLTFFVAALIFEERRVERIVAKSRRHQDSSMKKQNVSSMSAGGDGDSGDDDDDEQGRHRQPSAAINVPIYYTKADMKCIAHAELACPPPMPNRTEKRRPSKRKDDDLVGRYVSALRHPLSRFVLALVMMLYWGASAKGMSEMQVRMDTTNLIMSDSPLVNVAWLYERFVWHEGTLIFVFVNSPPDVSTRLGQRQVLSLADRFERLPYSMGANSTSLWLRPFLEQMALVRSRADFFGQLQTWLEDAENGGQRWQDMLRLTEERGRRGEIPHIDSFMFATAFAMGDDASWQLRQRLQRSWRDVASAFPELNVTVFQPYSFYVDQLDSISSTTLATVLVAAIAMDLACFLMIPSASSVISSTLAMISINAGVFGLLALWNVALDPIAECTLLMSIGFSVDFTAHISYHYFRERNCSAKAAIASMECGGGGGGNGGDVPSEMGRCCAAGGGLRADEAVADAIRMIGWPMLQAGMSTVICVLPLILVQSYMVRVFVKTIILVISLGLAHGILVLPSLLLAASDLLDMVHRITSTKRTASFVTNSDSRLPSMTSEQMSSRRQVSCSEMPSS